MKYLGDGIWVSDDFDEQFDFSGDVDRIREIIKEEIDKGNIKPIQDAKPNH